MTPEILGLITDEWDVEEEDERMLLMNMPSYLLDHLNQMVSPDEAKRRITGLGVSDWRCLLEEKGDFGSHELRALARICAGNKPRNLKEVYLETRKEDFGFNG